MTDVREQAIAAFRSLCQTPSEASDSDKSNAAIVYYQTRLQYHQQSMGHEEAEQAASTDTKRALEDAGWRLKI